MSHEESIPIQPILPSENLIQATLLPDRRGYRKTPAINPITGGEWDIRISDKWLREAGIRSDGYLRELALILPKVLIQPTAIFQGVRHEAEDEWLCYCGLPDRAYRPSGAQLPPYPNQVYLVYVNGDRVAYHSRWEKNDPRNANHPVDYDSRFERRLL